MKIVMTVERDPKYQETPLMLKYQETRLMLEDSIRKGSIDVVGEYSGFHWCYLCQTGKNGALLGLAYETNSGATSFQSIFGVHDECYLSIKNSQPSIDTDLL